MKSGRIGPKFRPRYWKLRRTTLITDVNTITLDASENTATIELQLPVGDNDSYAQYEEMFDFDEDVTPAYLAVAAKQMAAAMVRAVQERVFTSGPVPCETCTGNCCGRQFSSVRVTGDDVARMRQAGLDTEKNITVYANDSFTGYVGEFALVTWKDTDETACPYLEDTGCSIYEHRPLICHEYSPWHQ